MPINKDAQRTILEDVGFTHGWPLGYESNYPMPGQC